MNNSIKFSVIIPVYNIENYIDECINSILKQTYKNYELILVDDGSTDNSGIKCDKYNNDEKVVVIHQKNAGLSAARNSGLKIASGEYIIFIDGDDYIEDIEFLEKINQIIIKQDSDLIIYGYKKIYEDGKILEKKYLNLNKEQNLNLLIESNYYKACAWDKVVKSQIIKENKMSFPVGKCSEDIIWCGQLLKNIDLKKVSILNENAYCYRQRQNSITKTISDKNLLDISEMLDDMYMKDNDKKAFTINSYLAYEYCWSLGLVFSQKFNKELKEMYLKKKYLLKFNINKKVKAIYILSKIIGIQATGVILGKFINMKG